MIVSAHLISFLRKHWLGFVGLGFACAVGLWFVAGIVGEFLYFNDPNKQDVELKGWMTPKYVVLSYDLPRDYVSDVLKLTSEDQRGMVMRDIAAQKGVTLTELTEIVRAAAADFRAGDQ